MIEQFRGEKYIYSIPSKMNYIPGKVLILLCKEDDLLKSAKNLNRSSSLSLSPSYRRKTKISILITILHDTEKNFWVKHNLEASKADGPLPTQQQLSSVPPLTSLGNFSQHSSHDTYEICPRQSEIKSLLYLFKEGAECQRDCFEVWCWIIVLGAETSLRKSSCL